jgi:CPA2 family monovalent cation:H+ antiporter-2
VLLSMIAGAFLVRFNGVIAARLTKSPRAKAPVIPDFLETSGQKVVIGGYGRVGHTIAVLLHSSGVPFLAFDTDAKRVAQGRADGHPVSYGDVSDPELLTAIHVERAALVVITVDKPTTALRAITFLRKMCPQVPIIARARDLETSTRLLDAGAVHAYPETIEASLRLGATALQILHVPSEEIDQVIQGVRDWGYKPVLEDERDKQQ